MGVFGADPRTRRSDAEGGRRERVLTSEVMATAWSRLKVRAPLERPMRHVIQAALLIVAIIHLLPLLGVLGPTRLRGLYGVAVPDPNLDLLLRHRAVLFGIIGALQLAAIVHGPLRPVALLVGLASVTSFLVLAVWLGPINPQLFRVAVVDVVALVLLLGAGLAQLREQAG